MASASRTIEDGRDVRLTKLTITNFRSIKGTQAIDIPSQHIALVGSNNSGKSNVITALDWVLGTRSPYQLGTKTEDFYDSAQAIVIEAQIGDVGTSDTSKLMAIASSKQQQGKLAKEADPLIQITLTIPPFGGTEPDEAGEEDDNGGVPKKPTLGVNLWGFEIHQKTADRRRAIVQAVRVAPERNIDDDLKASRWTPYGQLMEATLEASPQYGHLVDLLADVNATIQDIFSEEKDALLTDARVVSYVEDIAFQLTRVSGMTL